MDFEDLIYNTVRLFNEHPDVLEHYQRQFKYVLIDEYQDTNHPAISARQPARGRACGNICVVGDDDQSIYKFRGATIENILSFENQYPRLPSVIRLEQNYRCHRATSSTRPTPSSPTTPSARARPSGPTQATGISGPPLYAP